MRIGISILSTVGHNIWNNGIGQNVYHLACLLDGIPFVERVILLDCGDQGSPPENVGPAGERFQIVPQRDATDAIDVVIEMAGGLDVEWTNRFRGRGGKVVSHICGQPYASFVEPTIFNRPAFFSLAERCDEVWLLPKDRPFQAMVRSIHRCPVHEVPYIWASTFLDYTASLIEQDDIHFGYEAGTLSNGPAIPAIFEPNISPIKFGVIPFMICEEIERLFPSIIARVHFMNGAGMADHPTFAALVGNSNLYKNDKMSIEARDYFARTMGRGANMVVSHQIECPQNYLYLDAIAGNYPLIHNSPLFSHIGYYYCDSNVASGVEQLGLAYREHDRNLESYTLRSQAAIAALNPGNRANRDAYARRLLALPRSEAHRRSA